jgi:hypothetical protein
MQQDNIKRIRNLRNKLHESIKNNGLDSDKTRKISDEIDVLINEYYNNIQQIKYPADSEMKVYYEQSYKQLKIVTQQLESFPSVQEWNKFAKKNCLLSSMSMQYISKLNWNYLRTKILRELNMEI